MVPCPLPQPLPPTGGRGGGWLQEGSGKAYSFSKVTLSYWKANPPRDTMIFLQYHLSLVLTSVTQEIDGAAVGSLELQGFLLGRLVGTGTAWGLPRLPKHTDLQGPSHANIQSFKKTY